MEKKKIISLCMATVMAVSAAPMSVFASSIGSTSSNTGIGTDAAQNTKTQYSEITENGTQTSVYLTVDDSDLIVSLPTTVIVSGTPDEDGNYISNYSVGVKGDMSGSKQVSITPDENVTLIQKGKDNKTATITQDKTEFTTDDFKNNTVTTGNITAQGLTAGSWNGKFNFNVTYSAPIEYPALADCAKTVLVNNNYQQTENILNRAITKTYFYIPVTPGSTLTVSNNSNGNILFEAATVEDNEFSPVKTSGFQSAGQTASYEVPSNGKYIYLQFKRSDNSNIAPGDVNFEDYSVIDSSTSKNIMNDIPKMVYSYQHAHLKNFDTRALAAVFNQDTMAAHAAGDQTSKNTIATLNNTISEGKFKKIEFDVNMTLDKEFVLYHDTVVQGMKKTIEKSTYEEILAVDANIPKLSDILAICKEHNIYAYLDCKFTDIGQSDINKLCQIIEDAGMKNSFSFCELYGAVVNKLPDSFKGSSRVVYGWNKNILNEPRTVYWSFSVNQFGNTGATRRRGILVDLVDNINQGCRYYSLWDASDISKLTNDASYHEVETFMATSIYLFNQCGGHGMYCFFEYFTPDFSNITEQDILNFIPQSIWAQTNVIEYR